LGERLAEKRKMASQVRTSRRAAPVWARQKSDKITDRDQEGFGSTREGKQAQGKSRRKGGKNLFEVKITTLKRTKSQRKNDRGKIRISRRGTTKNTKIFVIGLGRRAREKELVPDQTGLF